jgi:hypothetical protein
MIYAIPHSLYAWYYLFRGAGVAGTCTSVPKSTVMDTGSVILPVFHIPIFPVTKVFLIFLLGMVRFILISVFCSRFSTPALLLVFFFGVDLNVFRDVVSGNGVGERSCRRGRAMRSSVSGERIDCRVTDLGFLIFTGDVKSMGPSTKSKILGSRDP